MKDEGRSGKKMGGKKKKERTRMHMHQMKSQERTVDG